MNHHDDAILRNAYAAARTLEPTDTEIAKVMRRVKEKPSRFSLRRRGTAILGALALLVTGGGGYLIASPVEATPDDTAATFSSYIAGDDSNAPGRPAKSSDPLPARVRESGRARIVAESGGYQFAAFPLDEDEVGFHFGVPGDGGVGDNRVMSAMAGKPMMLLGLGAKKGYMVDKRGHVAIYGATARSITRVVLTYKTGPALHADDLKGGFALLVQPKRRPRLLVAYDGSGREVARKSLRNYHWSDYRTRPY